MFTHAPPKAMPPQTAEATAQAKADLGSHENLQAKANTQLGEALNGSPRAAAQAQLVQMMSSSAPLATTADAQGISDEEELIQSKSAVQRQEIPEEDELLQQKPVQRESAIDDELLQPPS
jgi:hypothetical protein